MLGKIVLLAENVSRSFPNKTRVMWLPFIYGRSSSEALLSQPHVHKYNDDPRHVSFLDLLLFVFWLCRSNLKFPLIENPSNVEMGAAVVNTLAAYRKRISSNEEF